MEKKEILEAEQKRITQKIKFFKRYIIYLIRIAIGAVISTLLFIYLMDAVHIDLSRLKISYTSLIVLSMLPTLIPLSIAYLLYTQLKELKKISDNLNNKLKNI